MEITNVVDCGFVYQPAKAGNKPPVETECGFSIAKPPHVAGGEASANESEEKEAEQPKRRK